MATLRISYDSSRRVGLLACEEQSDVFWFQDLLRELRDHGFELLEQTGRTATLPWTHLLAARRIVGEFRSAYGISISAADDAKRLLREAAARVASFEGTRPAENWSETEVLGALQNANFIRTLTPQQIRNVKRVAGLPAAAVFSVSGAGKTTEALAYYAIRAQAAETLFVVAPKNALGVWDEQLEECLGKGVGHFLRLRGGEVVIERLLSGESNRFIIITYQQLSRDRVPILIADFLAAHSTVMVVDESHHIKGSGVTSRTVTDLAFLPVGKLIISGTPMPQSTEDLIPQFQFMYPEVRTDPVTVVDRIKTVCVRTTKSELNLPELRRVISPVTMLPAQRRLYDLLRGEVARQAATTLRAADRNAFRALGRSVLRILQLISNPALLVPSWDGRAELLSPALEEGDSPKIAYAYKRARQLVGQGKKVLIWSSFRGNVEMLATRLSDLGAVFIHGGTDAGSEDDDDTREGRIRRFHDDNTCNVMVANPAAAGESISLHRVCHNAIYVDRTYNVAHYLQSEDRIHRLGTTVSPLIEIVQCSDSIDQAVASRLELKTQRMAQVLDDPDLNITPRVVAFDEVSDSGEDLTLGMDIDDVRSILVSLGGA